MFEKTAYLFCKMQHDFMGKGKFPVSEKWSHYFMVYK